ncbi:hypothetical protein [Rhizobacter sp. Root1221]|uniref:hypothetical protein n=1 Tax=Rhizobacter sp. Root1221 TaxID=1736433 RepID=UPI000701DF1F|nr:hypothetical protein [Rhizobacter sp. Root1221]KQV97510.1 hypothetical protein ASC87_22855 [Rhizobacter sp. Root1221]
MNPIQRVTVKKNERALLLRNGEFDRVLEPGHHWLFAPVDHLRVEVIPLERLDQALAGRLPQR